MTSLVEVLREIGHAPSAAWRALLVERFPSDPELVRQGLLWLAAERASEAEVVPAIDARYELVARLDSGATATVWRARDLVLQRTVAIKLFRDGAADGWASAIAEARAASGVISDHVVRVLDAHHGERSYIVMEMVGEHDGSGTLVPGLPASETRPRNPREAARWVMQIARGVQDAHLRNVFHRDLNPRNVLITPISRRALIADFGLAARDLDGAIRGTPGYIAPELVRGETQLDPVAIDVWGLGAIAYDLVSGQAPWPGEEPWDLAASGAAPSPLPRSVPRTLRRIVAKALALDPRERYASAAEVADELDAFKAALPTTHDRSRVRRVWLWGARNPQVALTGIVAGCLLALVAGAVATLASLREEARAVVAVLDEQRAEQEHVAHNVHATRDELTALERRLARRSRELRALETRMESERAAHSAKMLAKERALERAALETRALHGRLDDLQEERALAAATGQVYEQIWMRARREADVAVRERVRVEAERDAARAEIAAMRLEIQRLHDELDKLRPPAAPVDPAPDPAPLELN